MGRFGYSLIAPLFLNCSLLYAQKPIQVILIAGDETAIGTPLRHESELKRIPKDGSIPFGFLIQPQRQIPWIQSSPDATLQQSHLPFGGPELGIVRGLQVENPQKSWAVFKLAQASSTLLGDWIKGSQPLDGENIVVVNKSAFRQSLLARLLLETDRFLFQLRQKGYSPSVAALIWSHETTHYLDQTSSRIYAAGLHNLIDTVRDRYGLEIPLVLLNHISVNGVGGRGLASAKQELTNQKEKMPREDPLAINISTKGLPRRNHQELSSRGQLILGQRIAADLWPLISKTK